METNYNMANKIGESQQKQQQQQPQQYDNNNKIQCKSTYDSSVGTATTTPLLTTNNSINNNSSVLIKDDDGDDDDLLKQPANDTTKISIIDKKNFLLEHAKLVAEYYLDYNNMRMTNGPPDVFLDVGLNGTINNNNNNDLITTTTASTTTATSSSSSSSGTTTTTTSSSFSFKHFLSNNSRDMTAPSSTVTSLDPIIISNNQQQQQQNGHDTVKCINNKSQSSCSLTAISDPTKPYQTSTGARPKIPQSNSISTTSICTLMNNTRLSDVAAVINDNNNTTVVSGNIYQNYNNKMKRSPRFSSFDSQASLAEYVGVDTDNGIITTTTTNTTNCGAGGGGYYNAADAKFQQLLQNDYETATAANDIFPSANHNNETTVNSIDLMCKLVPRSYSNYDMPLTGTPRRRIGVFNMDNAEQSNSSGIFGGFNKEARPTRLSLNINNKFQFDLNQTHNTNNNNNNSSSNMNNNNNSMNDRKSNDNDDHSSRHMDINNHEIGSVAASALPDFVQDHWLEAWHVQESMRLNSPATSPVEGASGVDSIRNCNRGRLAPAKLALIGKPLTGVNLGPSNFCGVIGDKRHIHNTNNQNETSELNSSLLSRAMGEQLSTNNHNTHNHQKQHHQNNNNYHDNDNNNPRQPNMPLSLGLGDQEMGIVNADIVANAAAERNSVNLQHNNNTQSNTCGSKMLPDFLADGPIIHSAQRLADIAAGLPPNSVGSPEESSMMTKITNLRLDNERLLRELNETRMALNEQTRRSNQLDRQLQQQQQQQKQQQQQQQKETNDASTSTAASTTTLTTSTTTSTDNKTNNVTQTCLNAESEIVALRLHVTDLTVEMDKLRRDNAILREGGAIGGDGSGSAAATTSGGGTRSPFVSLQPRTQHQFSKDLMRAASNAESSLRQLLTGVENLRQMANEIENIDWRASNKADISPDRYPDYYDDCNDPYEEFRSGPAL